jgi:hypothetical protein
VKNERNHLQRKFVFQHSRIVGFAFEIFGQRKGFGVLPIIFMWCTAALVNSHDLLHLIATLEYGFLGKQFSQNASKNFLRGLNKTGELHTQRSKCPPLFHIFLRPAKVRVGDTIG